MIDGAVVLGPMANVGIQASARLNLNNWKYPSLSRSKSHLYAVQDLLGPLRCQLGADLVDPAITIAGYSALLAAHALFSRIPA